MSIILTIILILTSSTAIAAPLTYDEIYPKRELRQITVRVKNPGHEERQAKLAKYEEVQIEREIQRLEREEARQHKTALRALNREVYSLYPTVILFNADGTITSDINKAFINSILYPDRKG